MCRRLEVSSIVGRFLSLQTHKRVTFLSHMRHAEGFAVDLNGFGVRTGGIDLRGLLGRRFPGAAAAACGYEADGNEGWQYKAHEVHP
jgi:hypothetical protein